MKGVVIGVIVAIAIVFLGFYWLGKVSEEQGRKISAQRINAAEAEASK
ncbi:MAG: hypothetical protein HYZ84_07325 [Candidatus Omnitrophica bacterium]|nr:hypothetical protein [Candidatus Omnitrophota bacterium]